MARKYRTNREDKVDLKRTESSFSDDLTLKKSEQISRKNDDVKTPSVGIYDIDMAFKTFLEKDVKPTVEENGTIITVPVMYSTPENWSTVQRDGFMRDASGKILAPVITFKRNSLDINTELSKLKVLTDGDTSRTFVKKYSSSNRYDSFTQLIGEQPINEYYVVDTPDYVNISYDIIIWCDYMEDLNKVVEQIIYFQGGAFGDRYKFQIKGDSYSFETTNGVGDERIVRSNATLTVKAYLVPEHKGQVVNASKAFGQSKINWNIK
tara:strand:- start:801 stop:1595 length:795 start_codon:yes stop_codon:yes gene_type:complete